jgi:hypothetical protein
MVRVDYRSASGARKQWTFVCCRSVRDLETFVRRVCEVVDMALASHDGVVCPPGGQGWG